MKLNRTHNRAARARAHTHTHTHTPHTHTAHLALLIFSEEVRLQSSHFIVFAMDQYLRKQPKSKSSTLMIIVIHLQTVATPRDNKLTGRTAQLCIVIVDHSPFSIRSLVSINTFPPIIVSINKPFCLDIPHGEVWGFGRTRWFDRSQRAQRKKCSLQGKKQKWWRRKKSEKKNRVRGRGGVGGGGGGGGGGAEGSPLEHNRWGTPAIRPCQNYSDRLRYRRGGSINHMEWPSNDSSRGFMLPFALGKGLKTESEKRKHFGRPMLLRRKTKDEPSCTLDRIMHLEITGRVRQTGKRENE